MDCLKPVYVKRQEMEVPCGKCNFCLQSKRMDWCFRLLREKKKSNTAHFITLTYDESHLPIDYEYSRENDGLVRGTLRKKDLQDFFKRLRKHHGTTRRLTKQTIRFYAIGEYGGDTERPHYHAILFNAEKSAIKNLQTIWGRGQVHIGRVTSASVGYVTSYTINRHASYGTRSKPFNTMSRRPGIGAEYLRTNTHVHNPPIITGTGRVGPLVNREREKKFFVFDEGHKRRLPRFYRDRMFSREERAAYNRQLKIDREKQHEARLDALMRSQPGLNAQEAEAVYRSMAVAANDLIGKRVKGLKSKNKKI